MKVTKLQAAGVLLGSAIDAFLRDDFVTAIHCAGAAEELCGKELVRRGGSRTLDRWWDRGDYAGIVDDKTKFISAMNMARDWVKHTNPSHPVELEIEDYHAFFSLQRAVDSYTALLEPRLVPGRVSIRRLGEWYDRNVDRLSAVIEGFPDMP